MNYCQFLFICFLIRLFFFLFSAVIYAASRKFFINFVFCFVLFSIVTDFCNGFLHRIQIVFLIVKFHFHHFRFLVLVGRLNTFNRIGCFFDAFFTHSAVTIHFKFFSFFSCKNNHGCHQEHRY